VIERDADVVGLARALVATPSVNPSIEADGAGEREVARLCAEWLTGVGLDTEFVEFAPGRANVVARVGQGSPVTMLNGHLDTVGVSGMRIEPFDPALRDGHLWGRGACDMKGGVACALAAARSFACAVQKGTASGSLVVALTADEEHESTGMQALVGSGIQADRALVLEPTELAIMPAHKGFLWLTARFRGRASHGSRPEIGVDAVRHAARFMAELEPLHERLTAGPAHPLLGPASFHFGRIRGGAAPSVYPDHCSVEVERRTLPGESESDAIEPFQAAMDGVRTGTPDFDGELQVDLARPPSDVSPSAPVVTSLQDALRQEGLDPAVRGMSAWVDAAYLNEAGIPAVCFGPGSIERAHTADEAVPIDELHQAQRAVERWLGLSVCRGGFVG